jgi:RimJ/RimL family protein N-acetyltransferase
MRLVDIYAGGLSQHTIDVLYKLLAERPPEANISHRDMPTLEQHRQFVTRRPYEAWYFIEATPGIVGAVYLTHAREIGIFIFAQHQRRGYATLAIEALRRLHPGPLLANVAPGNDRSHEFFFKLGARLIQQTYEL